MATKLSPAQSKVMKWLGKGWSGLPGTGSAVMVNGKRICNTDTMMALYRQGLVCQDNDRCWTATESGKTLTMQLGL